jgi:DNA-binding MarR family transcriptional regulator
MPASPDMTRDATALVVEAWGRERPDLDASPLEVFSRVTRLARYLDHVRAATFDKHGLQGWEFDVLAELRRSGAPYELTPGQMSAQMLITSGTMTNRIHRLQAAGLVTRSEDSADRRVARVRLTKAGRERVDAALADLIQREAELLGPVPRPARVTAAATLAGLLTPLEADGTSNANRTADGIGRGARRPDRVAARTKG